GDGPEDARPARIPRGVDDHRCVLVERDLRAVVTAVRLLRPDDNRPDDLAFLHRSLRRRGLHGTYDHVAHAGVAPLRAAHDADAEDLARAGVVGDAQPRLLLDHFATSTIS